MYVPAHFAETDTSVLHDLIAGNPLGVLITHGAEGLDANHIPFEIDRTRGAFGTLLCHVARANPLWQNLSDGEEVLVVFRAADAYISPTWYPSKHETHRQVPTWNYLVAHAHGRVTVRDDEAFVRRMVAKLTHTHEASQPVPWKMGDAPKDYLDQMLKMIVGIEIEVTRLVGKFKLSQNKDFADTRSAGEMLIEHGATRVGEAMLAAAERKSRGT